MAMAAGCTSSHHRVTAPAVPTTRAPLPTGAPNATPLPMFLPTTSTAPPGAPDLVLESYTFVSPKVGWVLGTQDCCNSILIRHTVNGGKTWTRTKAPSMDREQASYINSIRFANSQDGWLFGETIWSTHDGGKHWHLVDPSPGHRFFVLALEAAGGLVHVVGLSDLPHESDGLYGVAIASSAVGSDRFAISTTMLPSGSGPRPQASLALHGTAGWLTISNRGAVFAARLVGGRWEAATAPCKGQATLAAVSSTTVVAACETGYWGSAPSVTEDGYISTDSGRTYSRLPSSLPFPAHEVAAPVTGILVINGTPDGSTGELDTSSDGGRTWSSLYRLAGATWEYVGFTTPQQGEAIAWGTGPSTRFLMTTDGGHHWHTVNLG
jgi:photosystem II stability/assembly factor-like uncharacterized protein